MKFHYTDLEDCHTARGVVVVIDVLRAFSAFEHPHAALVGLFHHPPGEPRRAPRARHPRLQLRRHPDLRHSARHLPQSARMERGGGLLRWLVRQDWRNADRQEDRLDAALA